MRYEFDGAIEQIFFCHCSRCRKANGSAFSAVAPIAAAAFRVLAGEQVIRRFESSPGVGRFFCGDCASPLFSRRDAMPDQLRLRIGTLDTAVPPATPIAHVFAASKAEWFELCDSHPQYAERP